MMVSPTEAPSLGCAGEGRYQVIATLERGDVPVKSCGSMTEALLYQFEVEALIVRAGFKCPPMRVEMRAREVTTGVDQ